MASEHFQILDEKDEALAGIIETEHPKKRQPAVIFMNGFLDTLDSARKKQIAEMLQKDGFVTVRFDYTFGFGGGSGDVSNFTLSSQVQDAQRVIDYATRRGYVNPDKVIVFGHCFGGMAAILLSAFDERVKAVITLSTPYDFGDTRLTRMGNHEMARIQLKRYFHIYSEALSKEVRVDYKFFEDGLKKDMARAVRNLKQPVLIIHGRKDESIPVANAQEIYDRVAGPRELYVVETMEHHPTLKEAKEFYPVVRQFLKQHLKV